MSANVTATDELYRRYKVLALAAGAALVLASPVDELADAVDELVRDASGTACFEPAAKLGRLVRRARAGEVTGAEVEGVRASHRSLRREVWKTFPCEYVPCCAGGAHGHR